MDEKAVVASGYLNINPAVVYAPALRVVNAFAAPVDVLTDGTVAIPSLAAGAIGTATPASGGHTLVLRPTGAGVAPRTAVIVAVLPAPAGSDRAVTGMFTAVQCHHPLVLE